MTRGSIGIPLILAWLVTASSPQLRDDALQASADGSVDTISLIELHNQDVYSKRIIVPASGNVTFDVAGIPVDISFIIFQIHTYQYNVTLSYDRTQLDKVSNRSVFGSNIGLYVDTTKARSTQMYLKNDNIREVDALVAITGYDNKTPIPGGCNMEFDTAIAPYEKLAVRNGVVVVDVQPPSPPLPRPTRCETNPTEYAVYHMYLPEQDFSLETYFSSIKSMLTVKDILQNGEKISASGLSAMRRVHSAYIGVGSIYVGVATYQDNQSAYIPIASYACSPLVYPETCQILNDLFSKFVCAVVFFLGLFSVFQGPRCNNFETSLPPLFVGSVVGYILALSVGDFSNATNICITVAIGALFAIILGPLCCFRQGHSSVFYNLTPGFFLACVAYLAIPDTPTILADGWTFGAVFCTIVLAVSLVLCVCPANVVATYAIFASYMMILPIDYYMGSSLKYLIINVIRRATVPEFATALVRPPFQGKDKVLVALWTLLFLHRIIREWCPIAFKVPKFKRIREKFFVTERTPILSSM